METASGSEKLILIFTNKTPMYYLTHRRFSFANLVQANYRTRLSGGRIVDVDIDSDFDFFFVL